MLHAFDTVQQYWALVVGDLTHDLGAGVEGHLELYPAH